MTEVIEIAMLLIIVTICFLMFPLHIIPSSVYESQKKFETFLILFNKTYKYDYYEYEQRFDIFKQSLAKIEQLNANYGGGESVFGVTEFSDLSESEFLDRMRLLSEENQTIVTDQYLINSSDAKLLNDIIFSRARRDLRQDGLLPEKVDW